MKLLVDLVSIPSPSGNTNEVISYVEKYLAELKVETRRNRKGGLIATLAGKDTSQHRMLTAHVDTLGAMVKEIKSNGRLKIDLIGGFKYNSIEGEYCQIETSSGKKLRGPSLCIKPLSMYTRTPERLSVIKKIWKSDWMKKYIMPKI